MNHDKAAPVSACCFGLFKASSKSVQVLFNGIEAVMVLTLIMTRLCS